MTNWRLQIEGVAPLLAQYPEVEIKVLAPAVAEVIRGAVRKAKSERKLDARDVLGLDDALDELRDIDLDGTATEDDFDYSMAQIYNWADDTRVWIDPVR